MTSPTQLSLKLLRRDGGLAAVVERWNPHAKVRQDLFGFIDVLAVTPGVIGVLAVQTTSASNQSARIEKIFAIPAVAAWLASGNRIEVHGWRKSAGRWTVTVTHITAAEEAATNGLSEPTEPDPRESGRCQTAV